MSRSLQFDIVANDKATGTLKGVQGAAASFAKSLSGMVTGMLSVQAVVSRMVAFGQEAFNWGSALTETAAGIGITVTELQQLQYAAGQSGVEVGKLNKGFLDLRKIMRDAQSGNAKAVSVMQALGYTQDQISSGSVKAMDAFLKVSEAISSAKTEQEKFNIATAVFAGETAVDMIKVVSDFGALKKTISETPLISNADAEKLNTMVKRYERIMQILQVITAIGISRAEKNIPNIVAPGSGGLMQGIIGGLNFDKEGNQPPTAAAQAAADALAKIGAAGKNAGSIAGGGGSEQFTALQQIGGAAGFRSGAGQSSPELTALEKIEENTRPGGIVPANGSTNFTNGGVSDAEYSSFVRVAQGARFSPRRRDRAPR